MHRTIVLLALVACGPVDGGGGVGGGAGGGGGSGGGGRSGPTYVNIDVVGALIGPALADGTEWDGTGTIPSSIQSQFTDALTSLNPYAAVASIVGSAVLAGTEAPDPYGTAEISIGGTYVTSLRRSLYPDSASNQEDTFAPIFTNVGWQRVELEPGIRVRVTMFDEDLLNDDPIGVAEISASELQRALTEGVVTHVNVSGQTQNQLAFINISVRASP